MTETEFRSLILSFSGAVEHAHMGYPDFRINNRVFATLGYPEAGWAMVKLSPEQQDIIINAEPKFCMPVKGAWGKRGATLLHLIPTRVKNDT